MTTCAMSPIYILAYRVYKLVNNARNDSPDCIKPA